MEGSKHISTRNDSSPRNGRTDNDRSWSKGLNWRGWLSNRAKDSWLEFVLVRTMLVILMVLVTLLIVLPFLIGSDTTEIAAIIDYSKWVLTALLAAFGAWIGAGAAYFFGKENLIASNKSTQEALKLQRASANENAMISDMHPMPLNPSFQFKLDSNIEEVLNKLGENVDYWFVPVIENGKLMDIVHTEAFWRFQQKNESGTVKDVIDYIDNQLKQKSTKLHGFYITTRMDELVSNASDCMSRNHATVGIVCDKNEKPTHCFSSGDLRSFKFGSS